MQEFIVVSFASFIGWQIFRYFSFFNLNVRVAPLFALAISFGITCLIHPSFLIAMAATGGVGLLNKITEADSPEPLKIPSIVIFRPKLPTPKIRLHRRETVDESKIGHRIKPL